MSFVFLGSIRFHPYPPSRRVGVFQHRITMGSQVDKPMAPESVESTETTPLPSKNTTSNLNVERLSHWPSLWNPMMSMDDLSHTPNTESGTFPGMCDVIRFSGSAEDHRNKRSIALYERDRTEDTKLRVRIPRIRSVVPASELPQLQPKRPKKKRNRTQKKYSNPPHSKKRRSARACLRCHVRKVRCTCSQTERDKAEMYWRRKRGGVTVDGGLIETVKHSQCGRDALCTRPNRHPGHCKFPWRRSRVRKRSKHGSTNASCTTGASIAARA